MKWNYENTGTAAAPNKEEDPQKYQNIQGLKRRRLSVGNSSEILRWFPFYS